LQYVKRDQKKAPQLMKNQSPKGIENIISFLAISWQMAFFTLWLPDHW